MGNKKEFEDELVPATSELDAAYAKFLKKLDSSDVTVSDWEAQFIGSNLGKASYSPKQRASIELMIEKYSNRIGW
jgi:hypothetical protein